jgi:hypothetical protein
MAHLSGAVRDYHERLADTEVWVRKAGQTNSVAETRANDFGEFEFWDLEPGRYILGATRSGYGTINTKTFWVARESQTRISVLMLKAGSLTLCQ